MKTLALFRNGDQHLGAYRNSDLRLCGVLDGAQKRLDAQVPLDPFAEQLDLPTLAAQVRNKLGLQGEVIVQKCDAFARFVLDHEPTQCRQPV